jgi:hypothetical protein
MRRDKVAFYGIAFLVTLIVVFGIVFAVRGIVSGGNTGNTTEATTESNTEQPSSPQRKGVYWTYSENKPGKLNFGPDAYAKAVAEAEKSDKYETTLDYLLDTDFDRDAYVKAKQQVKDGQYATILEAFEAHPDSGKLAFRLYYDRALTAAIAGSIDEVGMSGDKPILAAEKDLPIEKRPDAATQRFIQSQEDWDTALERIYALLLSDESRQAAELKEMSDYTSANYMVKDGISDGVPSVVVRESTNTGGHFIVFTVKVDGEVYTLRLRLECGYQAVDPHWPTPPDPPHDDGKDPKDDPQNNPDADKYDFYSPDKKNNEPDTTVTPEPESPTTEYKAPDPPEPEVTTEKATEKKTEVTTEVTTEATTEKVGDDTYVIDEKTEDPDADLDVIADHDDDKADEPLKDDPENDSYWDGFE